MAMTQDNVKGLDQLRQRLSQLSTSIGSLRADLERSEPLPTWPSLQSSAQALSFNLQQLMDTFNAHRQFLKEAHAYPLTNFPGHTHEGLLGQLLRKKLDPGVENWIEEHTTGKQRKDDESAQANGNAGGHGGLSDAEMRELWKWAGPTSDGIVRPMLEDDGEFQDDFTIAEREAGVENVVTGLKRKLGGESEDASEDEDEDEEEDEMEDVMPSGGGSGPGGMRLPWEMPVSNGPGNPEDEAGDASLPPMPLESLLKFATAGVVPSNAPRMLGEPYHARGNR
ncbi:mediator of RNA polymerase II transcription subunit 8 [Vermiconidia calcicola]|uniref:Mediator of RNA polymerase II transcription subunit 8 n=1 Tax=Vermiconidia calcicola TaxID=1690605 RepID=A0ACC3NE44_9PEZI|nr:mediator of RNA polymerase II transcription subunit 8 [Vermiconidia calcicola]